MTHQEDLTQTIPEPFFIHLLRHEAFEGFAVNTLQLQLAWLNCGYSLWRGP